MQVLRGFQPHGFRLRSCRWSAIVLLTLGLATIGRTGSMSAQDGSDCPVVVFGWASSVELVHGPGLDGVGPGDELFFTSSASPTWNENFPVLDPAPSALQVALRSSDGIRPLTTIELPDFGEATSVATHPSGREALVAVLDPARPLTGNGTLWIVDPAGAATPIEVGPQPADVSVSADGRFAIVAHRAALPRLPGLEKYRAETHLVESYREAALSLADSVPGMLGFPDLASLLEALALQDAVELLETARNAGLSGRLAELARRLGFLKIAEAAGGGLEVVADLDAFAADRGFPDSEAMFAALSSRYGVDAVFDAFLERGLVAERAVDDRAGSVAVVHLPQDGTLPRVVARVTGDAIHERLFSDAPDRAADARDIEAASVTVSSDSTFALISLQEQSAVISVDLVEVAALMEDSGLSPEEIGAAALLGGVLLPHGFARVDGSTSGVRPHGIGISPDGSLAVTANASLGARHESRHHQGISILDLRRGPGDMRVAATYNAFDLVPEFLADSGLPRAPVQALGDAAPADARLLPRLDPEDATVFGLGCRVFAAVVFERFEKSELIEGYAELTAARRSRPGSVLILDVTGALASIDGARPDENGRGGFVPGFVRRLDVGVPSDPSRSPDRVGLVESSNSLVLTDAKDGSWLSLVRFIVQPYLADVLSVESIGENGVYDVVLATNAPIAALSFGITLEGPCGSAYIVDVARGEDLPSEVETFIAREVGAARAIGILSWLLEPRQVAIGPGAGIRVARVLLCGTVPESTGCHLVLDDIGDPVVRVTLADARSGLAIRPELRAAEITGGGALCFRRGDAQQDGRIDVSDMVFSLQRIAGAPALCLDALDVNDDGRVNIVDALTIVHFLFDPTVPPPPPPGPWICGPDPTDDELDCASYESSCRE